METTRREFQFSKQSKAFKVGVKRALVGVTILASCVAEADGGGFRSAAGTFLPLRPH